MKAKKVRSLSQFLIARFLDELDPNIHLIQEVALGSRKLICTFTCQFHSCSNNGFYGVFKILNTLATFCFIFFPTKYKGYYKSSATDLPQATSETWNWKVEPVTILSLLAKNCSREVDVFTIIISLPSVSSQQPLKVNRVVDIVCYL